MAFWTVLKSVWVYPPALPLLGSNWSTVSPSRATPDSWVALALHSAPRTGSGAFGHSSFDAETQPLDSISAVMSVNAACSAVLAARSPPLPFGTQSVHDDGAWEISGSNSPLPAPSGPGALASLVIGT